MSSVEKALKILSLLSKERPVLRVGEVCRELDLPKSSVSRLLRVLHDHGLLERDKGDFSYHIGRRVLALSDIYLARHSLLDHIDVTINNLVQEFGFVGYAAVLSDADIIILRVKYGVYPLRLVHETGKRMPAFTTAIGRTLLARKTDVEVLNLVPRKSARERKALVEDLESARFYGVATVASDIVPGITATAAAIENPATGERIGLSLSYPMAAADEQMRIRMATRIRKEVSAIGVRLGDPYWVGRKLPAVAGVITELNGPGTAKPAKKSIA